MARHTLSHAVDLYSGEAVMNGWLGSNRGLPIDLLILDDLGAPAIADDNGYVTAENLSAAGNYVLDGALGNSGDGGATADVARGVQIVSAGSDTAILTFTGTDKFGNALTEAVTLNGTNVVFGKKAFKKITTIAADGANSNNIKIGTSDLIGLTYRAENAEDVIAIYENKAAARSPAAAAAAAPAGVTAVAVSDSTAETAAAVTITHVVDTLTTNVGDGMDATQESEINTLMAEASADFAAIKVELDKLVTDMANVGVTAANYKGEIDKLVLDVAAQKVELDKLILDVDLGTVGSFVKADKTAATTTTGDVRGTYNPKMVLDGSKTLKVLIRPEARTSIGAYGIAQA